MYMGYEKKWEILLNSHVESWTFKSMFVYVFMCSSIYEFVILSCAKLCALYRYVCMYVCILVELTSGYLRVSACRHANTNTNMQYLHV